MGGLGQVYFLAKESLVVSHCARLEFQGGMMHVS